MQQENPKDLVDVIFSFHTFRHLFKNLKLLVKSLLKIPLTIHFSLCTPLRPKQTVGP